MTGMIWIQTACLSSDITPQKIEKTTTTTKKADFEKKYQQSTKPWQITS